MSQIYIKSWKELKILHKLCTKKDYSDKVIISNINFSYNRTPMIKEESFTIDVFMNTINPIIDIFRELFVPELAIEQLKDISDARYEYETLGNNITSSEVKLQYILDKVKNKQCFSSILPLTISFIYNLWISNIILLIEHGYEESDDFGFATLVSISSPYILNEYFKKFCGNCTNKTCKLVCSRCNKQKYCNKECQIAHWKIHKNYCKEIVLDLD